MSKWMRDLQRRLDARSLDERQRDHEAALDRQQYLAAVSWDDDRTPEVGRFCGAFPVRLLPLNDQQPATTNQQP